MADTKQNGKSETGAQLPWDAGRENMVRSYAGWDYETQRYRAAIYPEQHGRQWDRKVTIMRLDPTLAMLRQIWSAPIVTTGWTVLADGEAPEEAVEFAKDEMARIHTHVMRAAALGCCDYGWAPFEKVYRQRPDGLMGVKKLKPLMQPQTIIETDKDTGAFVGLANGEVYLPLEKSLLFYIDVEGTDWYGTAIMRNAEQPFDSTHLVNASRQKTNARIAASHWVIYYPVGQTPVDGVLTDNFEVATSVMEKLLADGSAILPNEIRSELNILNDGAAGSDYQAWRIELLSASNNADAEFYTAQLRYEDSLKARAFGFPERSILEGQFGTKAEAESHGDMAIMGLELRAAELTDIVSKHLLRDLVAQNFGEQYREAIWLVANPIVDQKRKLFLTLYDKFLNNPQILLEEYDRLDLEEIWGTIGIPQLDESEAGNTDDMETEPEPEEAEPEDKDKETEKDKGKNDE